MPGLSTQFKFAIGTGTMTATSVAIPSTSVSAAGTSYFISNKERGDGYYSSGDGFHTVTYKVQPSFSGTLTVQATLATSPTEADWFTVDGTTVNYVSTTSVLTTTTAYTNFTGNFVWVRATVHRSPYIWNQADLNGSVNYINYNH